MRHPCSSAIACVALIATLLSSYLYLSGTPLAAQEIRVQRVGVAILQVGPSAASGADARDRVVKLLNQRKSGKNSGFTLEAVPLDSFSQAKAVAEAAQKNCDFVLFAHVTDLTTSNKLADDIYVPVFHAIMEFQLNRIDGAGFAIRSIEVEDSSSTRGSILAVLSKVAGSAWSAIESGKAMVDAPAITMATNLPVPSLVQLVNAREYCSWLPGDVPHAAALRGGCEYAISLPEKMPNFVCGQETARYRGENRAPVDLVSASVRYEDGHESYNDVKVNDHPLPGGAEGVAGLRSTGDFGGNLRAIFNRRNHALFTYSSESKIGDHAAWIFTYQIAEQKEPLWSLHAPDQIISPPYSGELWIDQEDGRVLRFRSIATDIPLTFPMRKVDLQIDYDRILFGDGTNFVLPVESTLTNVYTGQETSRNVVEFRDCHKFRARGRLILADQDAPDGAPAAQVQPSAAAVQKHLDESEQMFAAIRDQMMKDAEIQREAEQQQMLDALAASVAQKMTALRREQQRRQQQAIAKNAGDANVGATAERAARSGFRVDVRLVLVSAVPRDARGNAVGGLKQDNFRLFDQGNPQTIKHFSVETGTLTAAEPETSKSPEASESASGTVSVAPATTQNPTSTARATAYLFDDVHLDSAEIAGAREAARHHFSSLRAGERAAIFTTSGAVSIDFTDDRDELFGALRKLTPHAMIPDSDCPPISYYMADLMVNKADEEARGLALAEAVDCTHGEPSPHARHLAAAKAAEVVNTGNAESRSTLAILENVVRRTESMPGQRSIVLVSPGFLALTPDAEQDMMQIVDEAASAGLVINALDAGGLYGGNAAASVGDPQFGFAEAQARSDVMEEFASGTGGVFFHNNNNLDEGFRRTGSVPEFLYVLGFSPQKLDGKFHKLKVTLNAAGKFDVQARRGYYALKP